MQRHRRAVRLPASRRPALAGVVPAMLLAVSTGAGFAGEVAAGCVWCRTDPVVTIDGHLADIFVSAPPDAPLRVTGPNRIVVTVPLNVDTELVATDAGFGKGTTVTFANSAALRVTSRGIQIQIRVYVPARGDAMPVRAEFAHRLGQHLAPAHAQGTANEWVTLRALLTTG